MAKKLLLKERLKKKQEDLRSKGGSGNIMFLKADTTTRVRILYVGEEEEFIKEVTQFYLGPEIKGVISPSTFSEPCAITDAFDELKASKDDDDKELANKFPPRKRFLAYCLIYKDLKGKELDKERSPRFVLLTNSMYDDIIELYLDTDDWGDMTDPGDDGYDLKLTRVGSGKMDTTYSVKPCKNSPVPKEFKDKVYNLEEEVRKLVPSLEQTQDYVAKFLSLPEEDEPKKKKKLKKHKKDL